LKSSPQEVSVSARSASAAHFLENRRNQQKDTSMNS
jgi:hypothetical protein